MVCVPAKLLAQGTSGLTSFRPFFLTRFEQKNCYLSKIEIDKVLCFMCHVRTEVTAYNAVPCGVIFLVKFLLDVRSNVLYMSTIIHISKTQTI